MLPLTSSVHLLKRSVSGAAAADNLFSASDAAVGARGAFERNENEAGSCSFQRSTVHVNLTHRHSQLFKDFLSFLIYRFSSGEFFYSIFLSSMVYTLLIKIFIVQISLTLEYI